MARPASTYDAVKEEEAIEKRAQALTRIGTHYGEIGDAEVAEGITAYVAEHYSNRKARERTATPSGRGGRGR